MFITLMKSKIHDVSVTQSDLNYVGSITIDEDLMDAAGIVVGEKVQVVNNNNGERLETYAIAGKRGSGVICLNGAAARKVAVGDVVIIISYAIMTADEAKTFKPKVIFPDTLTNKLVRCPFYKTSSARQRAGQVAGFPSSAWRLWSMRSPSAPPYSCGTAASLYVAPRG